MTLRQNAWLRAQAILLITMAWLCAAASLDSQTAQEKPKASESAAQIRRRVELVNVDVAVTDRRGNFIRDLKPENFRVLDNGAEQPITYFAPVDEPAAVLLLLEVSPAVFLIRQQHLEAAQALLDGLAADDWVAVGTYDKAAALRLRMTQDKRAAQQALLSPAYGLGMGQLNLSDGVSEALRWLKEIPAKKAVVLISTGLDTSAEARWEALRNELRASEVAIFAIGLGGELRDFKGRNRPGEKDAALSFEQATRLLETIAETTGGLAYFPRTAKEFPAIYSEIAQILRHRYSLGFAPPVRDGRFHRIEVQVVTGNEPPSAAKQRPDLRILARYGYIAPAQD